MREPLSADAVHTIEQAWYEHVIILFRDQDLTLDQQKTFSSHFGELAIRAREGATVEERELGENVMLISNIRKNGRHIGKLPDGEMMFHTDTGYAQNPHKATTLYAVELPSRGGHTIFSNQYAVYDALPVRAVQRIGKLPCDVDGLWQIQALANPFL